MRDHPNIPIDHPKPDAAAFIDTILGKRTPDRAPMVEYIIDPYVMKPIVTGMLGREWVDADPADPEAYVRALDNIIDFWYRMGYDFVRLEIGFPFQRYGLTSTDTVSGGARGWVDQHHGAIESREDFERYPWPSMPDVHRFTMEYLATHLPDGMGLISCHAAGVFEHLSNILSYEKLCLMVHDDPQLVHDVCDRIGGLFVEYYDWLLSLPNLICVFQGDDMGFRTGTLLSPDQLREFTLPWQNRLAQQVHDAGRPYFLHSCGNLAAIMEDLIEDVKIDAKHSYEDAIMPIAEFQAVYGDRIGVLGGIDVDVLSARPPEEVRAYVRRTIDACAPRGRFAVGAGNSVPSYVPVENYLTMIDEAQR